MAGTHCPPSARISKSLTLPHDPITCERIQDRSYRRQPSPRLVQSQTGGRLDGGPTARAPRLASQQTCSVISVGAIGTAVAQQHRSRQSGGGNRRSATPSAPHLSNHRALGSGFPAAARISIDDWDMAKRSALLLDLGCIVGAVHQVVEVEHASGRDRRQRHRSCVTRPGRTAAITATSGIRPALSSITPSSPDGRRQIAC